jgi:NAD(P)-dependent dehydrogenase (short-subunit alcohol dehydrogenase family)
MLAGKIAVVTGGGNGIGRATARVMARYGAALVVADINGDDAERTAAEIRAAGFDAAATRVDVTIESEVARLVDFTVERFGRLDCAINNAGTSNAPTPFADLDSSQWREITDLLLLGTWYSMKHELRTMLAQGSGVIVNMASNAGKAAVPNLAPYGASKAAIINMTKTCAVEYGASGIRANAICPGVIMTGPVIAARDQGFDYMAMLEVPMQRPGEAEEVAELAAWLCSARASYITGQAISIDGGQSACQ